MFRTTLAILSLISLVCSQGTTQPAAVPLPNLANAVKNAKPGDTIVIRDGRYANMALEIKAEGRPGDPITLQAETPGGVVITGQCRLTLTGSDIVLSGFAFDRAHVADKHMGGLITLSKAYRCRITNNHFRECRTPGTPLGGIIVIRRNSPDTRIDHNTFDGSHCIAVALKVFFEFPNNTGLRVDHNHFINTPDIKSVFPDAPSGLECVQLGSRAKFQNARLNAVVEFNLLENVAGDGSAPFTVNTSWNTIRYNTFINSAGGPDIRHGHDCWIYGNVMAHCTHGIRISGANHRVAGNVIQNVERSGIALQMGSSANHTLSANDALIANNTILVRKGAALSFDHGPHARGGDVLLPQHVQFANNFILQYGGATLTGPSDLEYAAAANLVARKNNSAALPHGFRSSHLPAFVPLTLPVEFEQVTQDPHPQAPPETSAPPTAEAAIWAGVTQPGVKVRPIRVRHVGAQFLNANTETETHP